MPDMTVISSSAEVRRLALRERMPSLIVTLAAVDALFGIACWIGWRATGNARWITIFFKYPNALVTVALSAVALGSCFYVWRAFSRGDSLHNAWSYLLLASATHFIGRLLSQILSQIPNMGTGQVIYNIGVFLGGPAQMF